MNKHKFKIIKVDCCRCRAVEGVREVEVDTGITGRDLCISILTENQVRLKVEAEREGDELDNFEFFCTFGWLDSGNDWWVEEGEESMSLIIGEGHEMWDKLSDWENWGEKEQEEFEEWDEGCERKWINQDFEIV